MYLKLFRAKFFGQYLALLFLAVLLRIDTLFNPEMFANFDSGFKFETLIAFERSFPFLAAIISLIILILQALLLNQLLENNRITPLNQLLTAAIYITITSSATPILQPNIMLLVNLIMILALNIIFNSYGEQFSYKRVFDASLLTGLSSLLHFPTVWFLLFLWVCLMIYHSFTFRTLLITITGVALPWLYAALYFLWTDQLQDSFSWFINSVSNIQPLSLKFDPYIFIVWILFFILFISGYREISKQISTNSIEIRRKFKILIFFFVFSLATSFWAGAELKFHLLLTSIPLSAILSVYLSQTKKVILTETLMILILIFIFIGKIIYLI